MFSMFSLCLFPDVPPSIPTPMMSDVQVGEHRSRAVVQRDMSLAIAQLQRYRSSESPLVDLEAHGDWVRMQAYFKKCASELEVVKRSTKLIDFVNSLKELLQEELTSLLTSMADEVGPKGGGATAFHVTCMLQHGKLGACWLTSNFVCAQKRPVA